MPDHPPTTEYTPHGPDQPLVGDEAKPRETGVCEAELFCSLVSNVAPFKFLLIFYKCRAWLAASPAGLT